MPIRIQGICPFCDFFCQHFKYHVPLFRSQQICCCTHRTSFTLYNQELILLNICDTVWFKIKSQLPRRLVIFQTVVKWTFCIQVPPYNGGEDRWRNIDIWTLMAKFFSQIWNSLFKITNSPYYIKKDSQFLPRSDMPALGSHFMKNSVLILSGEEYNSWNEVINQLKWNNRVGEPLYKKKRYPKVEFCWIWCDNRRLR